MIAACVCNFIKTTESVTVNGSRGGFEEINHQKIIIRFNIHILFSLEMKYNFYIVRNIGNNEYFETSYIMSISNCIYTLIIAYYVTRSQWK